MPLVTWELRPWSDPNSRHPTRLEVAIDPAVISGSRPVVGPQLHIPYEVHAQGPAVGSVHPALIQLGGWLRHVRDAHQRGGVVIPQQPCMVNDYCLHVPLTDEQIRWLEDARAGGALSLALTLAGTATMWVATGPTVDAADGTILAPQPVWEMTMAGRDLTIGREQWLDILTAVGGERRRLVELPELQLPEQQARWAGCLRAVEQAAGWHRQGEYEKAVEDCRDVFEGIIGTLADQWNVPRRKGMSFASWSGEVFGRARGAWPSDPEAADTLSSLLAALFSWTSPTHHFGARLPLREESAFALSLAQALLEFAGAFVEAHPEPLRQETPANSQTSSSAKKVT